MFSVALSAMDRPSSSVLPILVTNLGGDTLVTLSFSPRSTITHLRQEVAAATVQRVHRIKLLLGETVLSGEECTLQSLGVEAGSRVTCIVLSEQKVVSSSGDGTAKIWSADTGECLRTFDANPCKVCDGTGKGKPNIFGNDACTACFGSGNIADRVRSVACSPNGRMLATASNDCILWDVESGQCLHRLECDGTDELIVGVAFSPDSRTFATASMYGIARDSDHCDVWDCASGQHLLALRNEEPGTVFHVRFSPDGRHVVEVRMRGGSTKVWDAKSGECLHSLSGGAAVFSPDGSMIATTLLRDPPDMNQPAVFLYGTESGERLHTFAGIKFGVFSPNGSKILAIGGDFGVRIGFQVYDVASGDSTHSLECVGEEEVRRGIVIQTMAFSPDGSKIVTLRNDFKLTMFDVETSFCCSPQSSSESTTTEASFRPRAAYSPDGLKLVAASTLDSGSSIAIYDAQTAQLLRVLKGHCNYIASIEFLP